MTAIVSCPDADSPAGHVPACKMTGGSRPRRGKGDNGTYISLITVAYNSARTIEATIRSVASQGYDNYEYIVIDGGSTDGTVDILRRHESEIDLWISEPDGGIYDAMNKGIALAHGDVVGILNSDDRFTDASVLSAVDEAYRRSQASIIHSNINVIYPNGRTRLNRPQPEERLRKGMCINHCTCFVDRKLYGVRHYDGNMKTTADYEFLLWSHLNGFRFHHLDRITVDYSASGTTGSPSLGDFEAFHIYRRYFGLPRAIILYLRDILPKLVRVPVKKVLRRVGLY